MEGEKRLLSNKTSKSEKLDVHGFLIGCEVEDGLDLDRLMKKIGETLNWYPGVGSVDIEHLGKIDVIEDVPVIVNDTVGYVDSVGTDEEKERRAFIEAMSEISSTKKES